MKDFPQPVRFGANTTRWAWSRISLFEAKRAGTVAPRVAPHEERYLSAAEVAARFGVTVSTVWRWATESARAARDEAA